MISRLLFRTLAVIALAGSMLGMAGGSAFAAAGLTPVYCPAANYANDVLNINAPTDNSAPTCTVGSSTGSFQDGVFITNSLANKNSVQFAHVVGGTQHKNTPTCIGNGCVTQQPGVAVCNTSAGSCSLDYKYTDGKSGNVEIAFEVQQGSTGIPAFAVIGGYGVPVNQFFNIPTPDFGLIGAPVVSSISPNKGFQGGGTTVRITGSGFIGANSVKFGGTAVASFTVDSDAQITTTAPAGSGTVDISVSRVGNYTGVFWNASNQLLTGTGSQIFTYDATQTIVFPRPADRTYGPGLTVPLAAMYNGSPNGVTYAVVNASQCTVSGTTVTITGAGTCSITASASGPADVTQTFTILKAPTTVTFQSPPVQTYSPSIATVDLTTLCNGPCASAGNSNPVVFNTGDFTICAPTGTNGAQIKLVSAGQCLITASEAGDANYLAATPVTTNMVINGLPQTVTFNNPAPNGVVLAQTQSMTLAATGDPSTTNLITFATTTKTVCTVSATGSGAAAVWTVKLLVLGTCAVTATQAADATHAAGVVTQTFQVILAPQQIAFSNPPGPQTFSPGAKPLALTVTGSATPVTITSASRSVCTVAADSLGNWSTTIIGAGTCSLVANSPSNGTVGTGTASATFTVAPATQTLSFTLSPATAVYAPGLKIALNATGAGVGNKITYSASPAATCAISNTSIQVLSGGVCTITASLADNPANPNYVTANATNGIATVQQTLTITGTPQVISFTKPADQPATAATAGISATGGNSGKPVTFASNTSAVCTVASAASTTSGGVTTYNGTVTILKIGACSISASQAADSNGYFTAAASVIQIFAIGGKSQVITFTQPADRSFVANAKIALSASGGGSNNPVTFTSSTPGVCTVATGASAAVEVAVGTCTITANQLFGNGYIDAASVTVSVKITTPAGGTGFSLNNPAPGGLRYAPGTTLPLTTANGTGTPAFVSSTLPICTVSVSTATIVGVGTCTITATSGTSSSSQSFMVNKGPQTIAFAAPASQNVAAGAKVSISATGGGSGNAVVFTSSTPGVCTVSASTAALSAGVTASTATVTVVTGGSCTLVASQAGSGLWLAAGNVQQSFQLNSAPTPQTIAFSAPSVPSTVVVGARFVLTATGGGSGVPVTFSTTTPAICTVATYAPQALAGGVTQGSGSVTALATGACTITAAQAGNVLYMGAASVTRSIGFVVPPKPTAAALLAYQALTGSSCNLPGGSTGSACSSVAQFNSAQFAALPASMAQSLAQLQSQDLLAAGPDTSRMHSRLTTSIFGETIASADNNGRPARPVALGATSLGAGAQPNGTSFGSGLVGGGISGFAGNAGLLGLGGVQGRGTDAPFGVQRDFDTNENERRTKALPFTFFGSADAGLGRFSFATSLSQFRSANLAEEQSKLAGLTGGNASATSASPRASAKPLALDVWVDGTTSFSDLNLQSDRHQRSAGLVSTGADAIVMPGMLIGVMSQYSWLSDASSALLQNQDSYGWMAGPYLSARLSSNVYFDAHAAWGQSTNRIDALGLINDTFVTDRSIFAGKLTGDWTSGNLRLRPSAEVAYATVHLPAFGSSLGVPIAAQSIALGRMTAGPEVGYRFDLSGNATFEPFVGVKAVWDFVRPDAALAATALAPVQDAIRGRVEAGATYVAPSGISVRATGAYDGVGSSTERSAVQGQATVQIPLQ